MAEAEFDMDRAQGAGITFSQLGPSSGDFAAKPSLAITGVYYLFVQGGKKATFPFGPKLLVSLRDTASGTLRWVFRSSGNNSWAVGALLKSKIDRQDTMMSEQTFAVATTGLAGGR
jgi:hypothetical protein